MKSEIGQELDDFYLTLRHMPNKGVSWNETEFKCFIQSF